MNKDSNNKPLVVFIDDDDGAMELYEESLHDAGFAVHRIHEVPEALHYIRTAEDLPVCWIVDLMMPVLDKDLRVDGQLVAKLARHGLASGQVLYEQIRARPSFAKSPVLILTSVPNPEILSSMEADMDDSHLAIEAKIAVLPSELPGRVNEIITACQDTNS